MSAIARRRSSCGAGSEDGLVAVFTVIILFTLLGIAALVLDLGGARAQREHNRGAADMAATAAALSLSNSQGADMVSACTEAWTYTQANLSNPTPVGSMNCSAFAGVCNPAVARTAAATAGDFTVTITNPVPDSDPLMGTHTLGGATQSANTIDGTACQRIGVSITGARTNVLAQIFGKKTSSTKTSSVGLASLGKTTGPAPGLIILDPDTCNALAASGQGSIVVQANGNAPGYIAIDSSGTGGTGGNSCTTGSRYTIDASGTLNASIKAQDGAGGAPAIISLYALAPGQGNTHAYDPSDVAGLTVAPLPTASSKRVTRSPVDFKFNCKAAGYDGVTGTADDCTTATATSDAIDQLHRLYDTSAPWNAPVVPAGFTTYPRAGVAGDTCSPNGAAITLPAANWYVNCPAGFSVSNNFTFGTGNVVFAGGVNAQGGSLTIGSGADPSTTIVYVRSGNLTKTAQAALTFNHSTVLLQNGVVNLGGGSGPLYWTASKDPSSPYDDLALWSESAGGHLMGAQTALTLEGVFFMPNAAFTFAGQGTQFQTKAQFVSRTLSASGQGTLNIQPDPDRGVTIPLFGVRLIR
ncbi:MAG: hypothetical protein QOF28_1024 [Actinomycetota bacterium]|jgi:Flp pilus assembly protein TadG|nr:hypothetical protein [Actinomycetota bacterium]